MRGFKPTVLVIEDEAAVRSLIVTILRLSGFDALHCGHAAEAQDLMAIHGHEIQILLTDVQLGQKQNGVDLAIDLQARYPHLQVLYISGWVEEGPMARQVQGGRAHFLAKPFTPKALTERVAEILAKTHHLEPVGPVLD